MVSEGILVGVRVGVWVGVLVGVGVMVGPNNVPGPQADNRSKLAIIKQQIFVPCS
jgi:hypothetical protein